MKGVPAVARRFEGKLEDWIEYVPNLWGERELFDVDPDNAITMEIHHLSKADLNKYERMYMSASKRGGNTTSREQEQLKELLKNNVRNIKNVDSPYDGEPITDGGELFERGEGDLVFEVTQALISRSKLEEGMVKKLRLRCVTSTLPRKASKGGDVQSVTQPSQKTTLAECSTTTQSLEYQTE